MAPQNRNRLIILDLDHTLIYAATTTLNNLNVLLKYSPYLTIYERPFARQLVKLCAEKAYIVVFTTAVKDYAEKVCRKLDINYVELRSRKDCAVVNGRYLKFVDTTWLSRYDEIIVIDDSPEIWDIKPNENFYMLAPEKYTGSANDDELKEIIASLKELTRTK